MVKNFKDSIFLNKKSQEIRIKFLKLIYYGFKFHIGGSLSCLDLLVSVLYSKKIFKKHDFFLLSKGHALGILYSIMIDQKKFSYNYLKKLQKINKVGGQLDIKNLKFNYNTWNTGSLGHTIGVSIGLSIAKPKSKIINIIGDAEIDEGSIWEALVYISEKKIKNIIIIIDRNRQSASSFIEKKEIFDKNFFKFLNINYYKINGHNHNSILNTLQKSYKNSKSTIIVAETIKGKGIKEFERSIKYSHGLPEKKLLKEIIDKYETR
jgi:transketolase